jgi:hypothetical protein
MDGDLTLKRGECLELRYGLAFLDEAAEPETVEDLYNRYTKMSV